MEKSKSTPKMGLGTKYSKLDKEVWAIKKQASEIRQENEILQCKLSYFMKSQKNKNKNSMKSCTLKQIPLKISEIAFKQKKPTVERSYCKSSLNSHWKSKDIEINKLQKDTSYRGNLKLIGSELGKQDKISFKYSAEGDLGSQVGSNSIYKENKLESEEEESSKKTRILEQIIGEYWRKIKHDSQLNELQKQIKEKGKVRILDKRVRMKNKKLLKRIKRYRLKIQKLTHRRARKQKKKIEENGKLSEKQVQAKLEGVMQRIQIQQEEVRRREKGNQTISRKINEAGKQILKLIELKNKCKVQSKCQIR